MQSRAEQGRSCDEGAAEEFEQEGGEENSGQER